MLAMARSRKVAVLIVVLAENFIHWSVCVGMMEEKDIYVCL